MGICCCKTTALAETAEPCTRPTSNGHHGVPSSSWRCSCLSDDLVLEALEALRRLADNEEEPPECMTVLHALAEEENGWLEVVRSCVFAIPLEFVLGAAIVSLLLDECPLPTKDGINSLMERLNLSSNMVKLTFTTQLNTRESELSPAICRNVAVVLGCLADKLAGPTSIAILNKGTLEFLLSKLNKDEHSAVVLFSILALEKFAQTSENKVTIQKSGISDNLLLLEELIGNENHLDHQVGFCAQWSLDNVFPVEGRQYSYEKIDLTEVNAMLNSNDVSEYLKISSRGLEARCDASSFESVRCTFCVESGVWYYEVTVLTGGVMQIGWATKQSKFLNHEGYGIGDDDFSCAYDGCRQLIWHAAHSTPHNHPVWKPGDVLGLVLDLDRGKLLFYLNGSEAIERDFKIPSSGGFFAAASFMSFQHCRFNFGLTPFKYPPSFNFEHFNAHATLSAEQKIVLPRPLKVATFRQESVQGDPCKICFEKQQDTYLTPSYGDICMACALQLEACPICRQQIEERCLQQVSPMSESYSFEGS